MTFEWFVNHAGRLVMLALLALTASVSAAQDNPIPTDPTVTARPITGLNDPITRMAASTRVLSPDGTRLAGFGDGQLCIFDVTSGLATCTPAPADLTAPPETLAWSPDGTRIAFSADVFREFAEGDIWVFDVAGRTFTNRTDDGVAQLTTDIDPATRLDYAPTWDAATGALYFVRSVPVPLEGGQFGWSLELMRFAAPDAVEPERVLDFTGVFPPFSLFRTLPLRFLNSPLAISPDGTRLALLVRPTDPDDVRGGVWLLDMNDVSSRVRLTRARLPLGLPDWEPSDTMFVTGLAWASDGSGLVVATTDPSDNRAIAANVHFVDVSDGQITPLLDFSRADRTDFFSFSADEYPLTFFVPQSATMSQAGNTVLTFGAVSGEVGPAGLLAIPVPPGDAPQLRLLHVIENAQRQTLHPPEQAGLNVAIGGYIFTFTP